MIVETEALKCKQFGSEKEKIIVTITSDNIYQPMYPLAELIGFQFSLEQFYFAIQK